MLDLDALRQRVEGQQYAPLFVTVSGAHLYGFPSPDSDVDLRGAHRLPLRAVVGLDLPEQTVERKLDLAGVEVELVSHDLGKYLQLLVKNNGYVLEQIFSADRLQQEWTPGSLTASGRLISDFHGQFKDPNGFPCTARRHPSEPELPAAVRVSWLTIEFPSHPDGFPTARSWDEPLQPGKPSRSQ